MSDDAIAYLNVCGSKIKNGTECCSSSAAPCADEPPIGRCRVRVSLGLWGCGRRGRLGRWRIGRWRLGWLFVFTSGCWRGGLRERLLRAVWSIGRLFFWRVIQDCRYWLVSGLGNLGLSIGRLQLSEWAYKFTLSWFILSLYSSSFIYLDASFFLLCCSS